MARRISLAMVALLVGCHVASALNPSLDISQYAHTAWTIRDGFFKSSIIAVAQTPDGYLWLGTESGLLRFDGIRSVPWVPPADQHLPSANIRRLLVGRDGRLWIGTNHGLVSWKDGKLTHYPALDGQDILAIREDHEGTMWVGGWSTSTGRLCAIQGGSSQCYGDDGSLGTGVISLYEDRGGSLWVGASNGLWRWRPGAPKFYPMSDVSPGITAMIEGESGTLLIATHTGLKQVLDGKVQAYSLPGTLPQFRPFSLLRDSDGGLWIGTADRGLLHVHQGRMDQFVQSDGLSGDYVQALFEDHEGNVWAVAPEGGLDRFRDFAITALSVKQGLSNTTVLSVLAARDGSVWLSTWDGLNRWSDGRITVYRKGSSGLPASSANSLFEDDRGRIWVSTGGGTAYFENGRFVSAPAVPGGNVYSIVGDGAENIWISHQDGLIRLVQGRVAEQISWAALGRKDLAYTLLPDASGLWVGFFKSGIAKIRDGKISGSYSQADGLGQGAVSDLRRDGNGTLWAATQGGLSRVKNGHVTTLNSKNGLPCDSVQWMMEDDDHSVWLDTACGLVRLPRTELDAWSADPKRTIRVTVFDSSDGVRSHPNTSAYSPRVAKSRDGRLWYLPFDGVGVIDPRHLALNKLPPPVHIEQVTADRTTYDASSNLRLPPLVRDLEIDYTALSLVAPEKNRFRVKLEGRDANWKDVGNRRQAFYSDLSPRNYRFRVMASNNSGVWNEAGAAFDFSIAPAYYQTRWFQVSCAAALLAFLWALYRYRLHQVARQFNLQLEARVGERTRMARDLHDTLLQGFQGLMLRLQALEDFLPQGEAKDELEQTLKRADQVVSESRKAVHDLRLSTVLTNDLARAVKGMGDELSKENPENPATFVFQVEGHSRELHPIVRDEVYRITREALRNAFNHARAHHIEAEIIYAENLFRLRIRDDGDGIAPAILEEGRAGHYGLPGMRERAEGIGAKLDIWSGVGNGTEIDLSIAGSIAYGKLASRSRWRAFRVKS